MPKRATYPRKKKQKKVGFAKTWEILGRYGVPLIVQIGYKCDRNNYSVSKDRSKRMYFLLSCAALVFTLLGVNDTDILSLLESIVGVLLLCLGCYLEHNDLAKKIKPQFDGIPTDCRYIRTPVGTKLVLYLFMGLLGLIAYIFSGFTETWLINLALCAIEVIDTLFSLLIVIFDAEADIY